MARQSGRPPPRGGSAPRLPGGTQLVILFTDFLGHNVMKAFREAAREQGVPVVACRRSVCALKQALDGKAKPPGALGRIEELALALGLIQQRLKPVVERPVLLVDMAAGGGAADWQLQLALNLPEQGFTYQATLDADLSALALQLPKPYQKSAGQRALLHLVANGNTEQSFVALSYPQLLDFQAQLSHSSGRIERAQLMLGPDKASLTQTGFTVEIDLASAELTSWFSLLQPLLSKAATESGWLPPLQRVRGQIQQIRLPAELELTNTVFDLTPTADAWQLQLNGAEIASRWQFFHDWQAKGLTAELDYLHPPGFNDLSMILPGSLVEASVQQRLAKPVALNRFRTAAERKEGVSRTRWPKPATAAVDET